MNPPAGSPGPGIGPRPMDHAQIAHVTGRFTALRDTRLTRLRRLLSERRREVVDLLPLLFHLNHPHLPAYINTDVPAGLPGYSPERDTRHAARKYLRDQSLNNTARFRFVLRGLYLMGSSGTLGQDRDSDFDIWLIHSDDLPRYELALLQAKARAVEAWAKTLGVETHIYLMDAGGFRQGKMDALSNDSSGQTQHFLLLEEFYRTSILLAGQSPLWWLVPPDGKTDYAAHTEYLAQRLGIHMEDWIDFGPLDEVPADEFFSSAHWQLHKGIDAPYKAILKLMLTEAYAAQFPHIQWLSDKLKAAVYSDRPLEPNRLDPYYMILDRLSIHLAARDELDRLELARRSLYIKSGLKLSQPAGRYDWRHEQLRKMSQSWGWDERHWLLLDHRHQWKLERVTEERDALVAELSRSYHLLTEFARACGSDMNRNGRELSLLGRRLYAALERRPGKVDRVNPGISQDLSEPQLWISRHISGGHWRLHREPPSVPGSESAPLKAAGSLVEMLAWLHVNGLVGAGSHVQVLPRSPDNNTPEHLRILQVLQKRLGTSLPAIVPIGAFAEQPCALHSLAFINVAPPAQLDLQVSIGVERLSRPVVENIDHLLVTSWGEILVRSRQDGLPGVLDILCQHLNMTQAGKQAELYVHGFSSGAADALARRITELSVAIRDTFSELGDRTRYVFELEGSNYLVQRNQQEQFHWHEVGDREDLMQLLQEPQTDFSAVRLDPRKLTDTPLVRLFAENIAGVVQVFYRVHLDGIEMFCLDDCGALFHERYLNITEPVFLSQQKRLFDSLANRRLIAAANRAGEMLAGGARFYQLALNPEGWMVRPVEPPTNRPDNQLELLLVTSPDGLSGDNFTLVLAQREFDSLRLGPELYREVASHVLARRIQSQDYPIRITGVLPAGLEDGADWTVNAMLRTKRRIERRLTSAMRELERARLQGLR